MLSDLRDKIVVTYYTIDGISFIDRYAQIERILTESINHGASKMAFGLCDCNKLLMCELSVWSIFEEG